MSLNNALFGGRDETVLRLLGLPAAVKGPGIVFDLRNGDLECEG